MLFAIVRPYPSMGSFCPFYGSLLPCMGPFVAFCELVSSSSRGWFTDYVNRLLSLLYFFVCVCVGVGVPAGLSPDLYGFVLVHGEIFSS